MLILGIDYMEYQKYKEIAPKAYWDEKEGSITYPQPIWEIMDVEGSEELEKKWFSCENAFFSLNFVLDCILRWHL